MQGQHKILTDPDFFNFRHMLSGVRVRVRDQANRDNFVIMTIVSIDEPDWVQENPNVLFPGSTTADAVAHNRNLRRFGPRVNLQYGPVEMETDHARGHPNLPLLPPDNHPYWSIYGHLGVTADRWQRIRGGATHTERRKTFQFNRSATFREFFDGRAFLPQLIHPHDKYLLELMYFYFRQRSNAPPRVVQKRRKSIKQAKKSNPRRKSLKRKSKR